MESMRPGVQKDSDSILYSGTYLSVPLDKSQTQLSASNVVSVKWESRMDYLKLLNCGFEMELIQKDGIGEGREGKKKKKINSGKKLKISETFSNGEMDK
jgi:hypothetical protein